MSIGPTNIAGSAAGGEMQVRHGSEADRSKNESSQQARKTESQKQAEKSSGVGETNQDEGAGDRDADGQRLWEDPANEKGEDGEGKPASPQSKDPTGESGTRLDITG